MASEKQTGSRSQKESDVDLADVVKRLEAKVSELSESLETAQLRLRAMAGQFEAPEEIERYASRVKERVRLTKMTSGQNQWLIVNTRYKLPNGDHPAHEFWSDAETARDALADYKKRCQIQWDVSEGPDPFQAKLVEKKARPEGIKQVLAAV